MTGSYDILTYVSELGNGPNIMLEHLHKDQGLVDAYVEFSMTDHKYAWRAAWVIHHFSNTNPEYINKYADRYIQILPNLEKDGHIREVVSILINLKLSEEQMSELFEICYTYMQNNKRQSSVRSVCFRFMMNLADKYPELKEEIKIVFENIKDYISPGVRAGMEARL